MKRPKVKLTLFSYFEERVQGEKQELMALKFSFKSVEHRIRKLQQYK